MKKTLPVSDEILNAFVDDEIEAEERVCILALEAENRDVAQAICELRRLKTLVNAARADEPTTVSNIYLRKTPGSKVWYAAASLVIGIVAMIVLTLPAHHMTTISYAPNSTYTDSHSLLTAVSKQQNLKLVLHLKSADSESSNHMLSILQSVLNSATQYSHQWRVEVIASGAGMPLLLEGNTLYANKIRELHHQYPNITFLACDKTLQTMKKKTTKKLEISKEAMLVASGPQWARQRQQQGWTYILI